MEEREGRREGRNEGRDRGIGLERKGSEGIEGKRYWKGIEGRAREGRGERKKERKEGGSKKVLREET